MKKYTAFILLILLLLFNERISFAHNQHNNNNAQEKPYHFCNHIKKIQPQASDSDYKKLVQLLHSNDITVCECIQKLAKEKKEKAFKLLKKNSYVTQQNRQYIDEYLKKVEQSDANNKPILVVHIPENFPENQKKEIIDYYSSQFSIQFKQNLVDSIHSLGCSRNVSYVKKQNNPWGFILITSQTHNLYITQQYVKKSPSERMAGLAHEKHHMLFNHYVILSIVKLMILEHTKSQSLPQKEFTKLQRALEFEANTIPAACNSLECASNLYIYYKHGCRTSFAIHPSHLAMNKYSLKIYKLRKAEECLKNRAKFYEYLNALVPPLY